MSKKKLITIVSIILAATLVLVGGFLLFQKTEIQKNTAKPTPSSTPKTEEEIQEELKQDIEEFQTSEEYVNTINNYSQYLNIEESTPGYFYNPHLTIPSIHAVTKYIEEGYFNPYFVSNFWITKDNQKFSSIESFLGKYITDEYKEKLKSNIPDNINNQIYVPDSNFGIPTGCAEKWTDYECFALPPEIQKITYKGESSEKAVYTVEFQMNVNVQDPNQPLGSYTNQLRNYKVDFTVINTKPKVEIPKFEDVKIDNVSAVVEIVNTTNVVNTEENSQ